MNFTPAIKDKILLHMYEWSSKYYIKYFRKNNPWKITTAELLLYPEESLGFQICRFHQKYNLEMKPNLEEHDVIHVLTNIGVTVADEVALQYYLLGNGKKGPYSLLAIGAGTIFYPTQFQTFLNHYKRGRNAHQFYHLNFHNMLLQPVTEIQFTFNIK